MKNKFLHLALTTTALAMCAQASFAQSLPSTIDPARVDQRYRDQAQPATDMAPVETPQATNVVPEAEVQTFTLGGVKIHGMSAYAPDAFASFYSDKVGQKVSVADIQRVAEAIGSQYRKDGYVLARAFVPSQSVGEDGVINVVVQEGYVSKIVYDGEPIGNRARDLVRFYALKIKESRPLKVSVLERYLLLINDLPGKSAKAVMRPSATEPGTSELVVLFGEKEVEASFSSDNRNSRFIGPWQHSGSLSFNNALGFEERTTIRGITSSPTRSLRFVDVQQEHQIGTEGTKLTVSASHASTAPGDALKPLNIRGRSENVQMTLTHPFQRSRVENLTGRVSLDARNSNTKILGESLSKDRTRSLRAGATYDVVDKIKGINVVSGEVSQGFGLDFLGSTKNGDGRSRLNGEHSYTKFNLDITRVQPLPYGFSVYTAATGQYSLNPLLAGEQFTVGGPAFGTYYDPAEIGGDHGVAGKAELRWGNVLGRKYLESYQLYGYYDIGSVWLKNRIPGEEARESLASSGLGVRANINENLAANLEYAVPLTRDLGADTDNDGRVLGGLNVRF